jgi:hypothetical protein
MNPHHDPIAGADNLPYEQSQMHERSVPASLKKLSALRMLKLCRVGSQKKGREREIPGATVYIWNQPT